MKASKQKARDRLQPKMGRIDIDYQVLHDAFFKYQTKPKITYHGDLYYEGKEFEVHIKERKPGFLSADLMAALGMSENNPPPWLINMQRYGPPPSYPSMRIPGLSAPIPAGTSFGYHSGGWGKPPVDEYNHPLYGDVFGGDAAADPSMDDIDRTTRWGEVTVQEGESEEESEEEDEAPVRSRQGAGRGQQQDDGQAGTETPSTLDGMSTAQSGTESVDTTIDVRKRTSAGTDTPDTAADMPRELYTVLQERAAGGVDRQLFSSDRTYQLPGRGDVQLAINPDDLQETLRDKDQLREAYAAGTEDGDDDRNKRKRRLDASAAAKRYKDFKF